MPRQAQLFLDHCDLANSRRRPAACRFKLKDVIGGRHDLVTAKKLRWTIDFEKASYEKALNAKNQAAPSHMAVVRAAKAAAAASILQPQAATVPPAPSSPAASPEAVQAPSTCGPSLSVHEASSDATLAPANIVTSLENRNDVEMTVN